MQNENDSEEMDKVLSLFPGMDEGLAGIKSLTRGLGFKDRVSEGVYTIEMERGDDVNSDGGTLDIGKEELGDGILNIEANGELRLQNSEAVQPILFHSGHDGLVKKTAKKSGESLLGAIIDVLLSVAFTIFTVALLTEFTKYTFNFEKLIILDLNEVGKLGLAFATYFLLYKIFTRVFFGRTLGEWSSRHQLGLLTQQYRVFYPVQVLLRELVCLGTGIFILPLISIFLRRDMGYYFSGLQTYIEQKK